MYLDKLGEFDPTGSAITVTRDSTNVIDLSQNRDLGAAPDGNPVRLVINVDTTFTDDSGVDGTITISVLCATTAQGVSGTYQTLAVSKAYGVTELVAGSQLFPIDLPSVASGQSPYEFLKLTYTVANATFSTGKVGAWLVADRDDQYAYPSGFTVTN